MNTGQSFPLRIAGCFMSPAHVPSSVISSENQCYIDLSGWEVVPQLGHPFHTSLNFLTFPTACRIPNIDASLVYAVFFLPL